MSALAEATGLPLRNAAGALTQSAPLLGSGEISQAMVVINELANCPIPLKDKSSWQLMNDLLVQVLSSLPRAEDAASRSVEGGAVLDVVSLYEPIQRNIASLLNNCSSLDAVQQLQTFTSDSLSAAVAPGALLSVKKDAFSSSLLVQSFRSVSQDSSAGTLSSFLPSTALQEQTQLFALDSEAADHPSFHHSSFSQYSPQWRECRIRSPGLHLGSAIITLKWSYDASGLAQPVSFVLPLEDSVNTMLTLPKECQPELLCSW